MASPRLASHLGARYRAILAYTGLMAALVGGMILSPLVVLFWWPEELSHLGAFLAPGGGLGLAGLLLFFGLRPRPAPVLSLREGSVIVTLGWLLAVVAGALPLMATAGLHFTQAVFVATSGWTTTGLSVVDVEAAPRVTLLYLSNIQLAGGAGFAILMLAAFGGPVGVGLANAEGRDRLLVPHVRRSAELVVAIYAAYNLAGILALRLAGIDWYNAVNHAICSTTTGGYSTRTASIGYWDDPWVEGVICALMILGNLNFLTSYALVTGRFRALAKNGEARLMAFLFPLAIAGLFLGATAAMFPSLGKALRVAIFECVSALTTTGYSTVDYTQWNPTAVWLLVCLMLVGGGVCSTAGAIKQIRVYILYRFLVCEFRRLLLPAGTVLRPSLWQGDRREFLGDGELRQVAAFVFLYLVTYALGVGVLAAHGYSLSASLFEFASALGTVGLSVGLTSATTPPGALWTMTLGMLLGRLEFFVLGLGLAKLMRDAWSVGRGR